MRSMQTLSPFIMFLTKIDFIFGLKALTKAPAALDGIFV
jgi:hypothetical protein